MNTDKTKLRTFLIAMSQGASGNDAAAAMSRLPRSRR
jgi:hypothetical protein